jgi:hypothetical protein
VLEKLIDNAMKFTRKGGRIVLAAEREDEQFVRIRVDDSGVGIAPRYHESIFDRFRQIGDVLTDRPQGSGLGLPICREFVANFGGRIWVESTPGQGSSFRFTVPVATIAETRTRQAQREGESPELVAGDESAASDLAAKGRGLADATGLTATLLDSLREHDPDTTEPTSIGAAAAKA